MLCPFWGKEGKVVSFLLFLLGGGVLRGQAGFMSAWKRVSLALSHFGEGRQSLFFCWGAPWSPGWIRQGIETCVAPGVRRGLVLAVAAGSAFAWLQSAGPAGMGVLSSVGLGAVGGALTAAGGKIVQLTGSTGETLTYVCTALP